jgi:hypothetical protein
LKEELKKDIPEREREKHETKIKKDKNRSVHVQVFPK